MIVNAPAIMPAPTFTSQTIPNVHSVRKERKQATDKCRTHTQTETTERYGPTSAISTTVIIHISMHGRQEKAPTGITLI